MTAFSRREFGKIVIAGVPLAAGLGSSRAAAAGQVPFGVTTTSFRELPRVQGRDNVDDVLRAAQAVGATRVELALSNVEPPPPNTGSFIGGTPAYPQRITFTPEQVASMNAYYRAGLREWRLETSLDYFKAAGQKFTTAGMTLHSVSLAYNDSFTDAEIDATFRQVK